MRSRLWLVLIVVVAAVLLGLWWRSRPVSATVSVYFIKLEDHAFTLQEVPRKVRARGPDALLAAAMQELLSGPASAELLTGLTTEIPKGTHLRSVQMRGDIVVVDFGREVESGGGSASMLGRFWQIVYTATQVPQAPRVRILIEGREQLAMGGEGVIIDHPIERPSEVPHF